jgi:hypothetical protein
MDARAAIPPTLPRENPTISYWQDPPDAEIKDYRSEGGLPERVDTVVVGSGISGACVAWGLLGGDAEGNVVMLEARQACSGATGRNGQSINPFDLSRKRTENVFAWNMGYVREFTIFSTLTIHSTHRRPHQRRILPLLSLQRPNPRRRRSCQGRPPRIQQHKIPPLILPSKQHRLRSLQRRYCRYYL